MAYTEQVIDQVWRRARAFTELNPETWREDECGAWIRRGDYGQEGSDFGWKIENVSAGGSDTPENLRAFHHSNGYDRANRRPTCRVTADRTHVPTPEQVREPRNRKS
ncbi:MAG: hypothetical protein A3G83_03815 [Betaproteobacteria bacterium RIFCSPLOWO2_12_FULL_68_20]|nr:MAG: hypothetical protein A3G83_03815 [Betaproteobacteria bacterium RIFCSPLOWO2_12_FULL_68_20]